MLVTIYCYLYESVNSYNKATCQTHYSSLYADINPWNIYRLTYSVSLHPMSDHLEVELNVGLKVGLNVGQ